MLSATFVSLPPPFSVMSVNDDQPPHAAPVSVASERCTCVEATPDSPSPADVVTCTECEAYVPLAYEIDPVGGFRSDCTVTESAVAFGARVTEIESVTGVPSQVYGAEANDPEVGLADAPVRAPALAGQLAEVTPFRPSGVSSSANVFGAEPAGPSQRVVPLRKTPAGAPAASWIGEPVTICVIEPDENVEETPALFVTTISYA